MWIKLIGANFSANNIGTLKSYKVDTTGLVGLTVNPKYVSYKTDGETISNVVFTFTVSSGYKFASGSTIKIGSETKYTAESDLTAGSTFTITMDVKGDIAFVGVAEKVAEPDAPVDPGTTNYTFTINPTPTSATVTLSATGYSTASGTGSKSITVANGTTVNWSVSADGYITRTGNWTADGSNKTENVVLSSGDVAEYAIYDSFDRDNTDDGIGSTDTGETWEVIVGSADTGKALLKIYDGKVKGNTEGKYPSAVVAATELDRYVEMEIAVNKGGGQILVYDKYEDATNYIAARKGKDGIITLLKKIDGVNREVAKTTEKYTDDNLVLAIQCIGNDHTVFANGTQILTGTITEFASATRVGFSINETSDMCDNFKVKYL